MKKRLTAVLFLAAFSFALISCKNNAVESGKYFHGDGTYIEVKDDMYIAFYDVDFTEVQDYYDQNNIDINIAERTQGDVPFELSKKGDTLYVLTDESVVLNIRYDKKNQTLTFLDKAYVLGDCC
jgi:hypothetical protein